MTAPSRGADVSGGRYDRNTLTAAIGSVRSWNGLMRALELNPSGGQRRVLQEEVAAHGIDTSHFAKRSPWRKYPDDAIASAAASSSSLREVAVKLGATPATGTLSHIRRRITASGIDISHFPNIDRPALDLPFTREELRAAAATTRSMRGVARALGVPDDSRSRDTLARMLREHRISTEHFAYARPRISEDALRKIVPRATSYADVMRSLGLTVDDANHRRVRRTTARLGLDTSHFKRRSWGKAPQAAPPPIAHRVLVVLPEHSARTNRTQLHRALRELGMPYSCASCGNPGEWLGRTITLQIDHVNGDWHDNRQENLRYLCPNCHALTETWCRRKESRRLAG